MLDRIAGAVIHRRRLVLWLSAAALVLMAAAATTAFSVLRGGGFDDPSSQSSRALTVVDEKFGGEPNLLFLVTPEAGKTLNDPGVVSLADRVSTAVNRQDGVTDVQSWWRSPVPALKATDGSSALITLHVPGDEEQRATAATDIIDAVETAADAGPAGVASVRAGGALGTGEDITEGVGASLALAELIAVPLTLLLLFFVFGSIRAAVLPLVIGGFAIAGTFAELALLGRLTDVSIYGINLTTALGLGLAVDYSLLIVNRFREQLASGAQDQAGVDAAVIATMRTAGRTVLFSSATVAVALTALLLFPVYFLRSFAYAGIGVVLIALIASLTTLPALMAVFGTKLASTRRRSEADSESAFWRRIATAVMKRPVAVGTAVVAVLLVLGTPFLHATFGSPDDRVLRDSAVSRQVGDVLRNDYKSTASSAVTVVIEGAQSPDDRDRYLGDIARLPGVSAAPKVRTDGSVTLLSVAGPVDASSEAAKDLVRDIRDLTPPPGTTVLVGGPSAVLVDSQTAISDTLPWALLWIVVTTVVLLFLFTGSVLLPLKAIALNALSLTAVFGAMVWIFQDGHLAGLLGFTPLPLNSAIVVLMFVVTFGLSMDYEVFLLARIKEAHDAGAGTVESVATGLARSGRIVTAAAALLAVTFFAFGTAQISFLQLFGIGVGIAIVLDATIIRGLLVPAFMKLAGEANWWAPAPLRALHKRIGLDESAGDPVATVESEVDSRHGSHTG